MKIIIFSYLTFILSFYNSFSQGVMNMQIKSGGNSSIVQKELTKVTINENLGKKLKLKGINFLNQYGKKVYLEDLIKDKPIVLSFGYYTCPLLCGFVLQGKKEVLQEVEKNGLTAGKDYRVISISFDKKDTVENAQRYYERYSIPEKKVNEDLPNWSFLVGNEKTINNITSQIGFQFKWIEANQEYAHAAAIYIITPERKISRYLYGMQFNAFDIKLALIEAKKEAIRTTFEKVLLYCYRYDSNSRGYVLYARNIMKASGIFTIIFLSCMLLYFFKKEKNRFTTNK